MRSNLKGDIMAIIVVNPRGYTNEVMSNEQRKVNEFLKNCNININSLYFHPR